MRFKVLKLFFEGCDDPLELIDEKNFIHTETGYNAIHWLSFHNDHVSAKYILDNYINTKEQIFLLMRKTYKFKLTPLDIAGHQNAIEVLKVILQFFKDHFTVIYDIFQALNWKQLGNLVKKNPNFIMPNMLTQKEKTSVDADNVDDVPHNKQVELKIIRKTMFDP